MLIWISKIIFIVLIFANLIISINTENNFKEKQNSIIITDGNRIINKFNLDLYDTYIPKNTLIKYDITAKLAYLPDFDRLKEILDKYSKVYNNEWVFLIDDIFVWNQLENVLNNKRPKNFLSFIWHESLKMTDFYYPEYPVFIADTKTFINLTYYSIENESGNFFININYDNSLVEYPQNFLNILSALTALFALITTIFWHFNTYKFNERYTTSLQRVLTSLPYIKLILSLLIFYNVRIINQEGVNENQTTLIKVYLDTLITTLSSIFRTIFWFTFVLISCGWQLYKQILNRSEMRKFVGIYIFIYLSVCFDQIIDLMINRTFGNFLFSELKNIGVYSILAVICFYNTYMSILFLKRKYSYAYILAPDYMPSLLLKIKMLIFHLVIILTYSTTYILFVIIQKCFLIKYSSYIVTLVSNNALEMITLIFYLFIFRSRRFPDYFLISYDNEDLNENGNVYQCKLPNIKKLAVTQNDFQLFNDLGRNPNKKEINKQLEAPLIIINPIFPEEVGILLENNVNVEKRTDSVDSNNNINNTNVNLIIPQRVTIQDKISIGFYKKI